MQEQKKTFPVPVEFDDRYVHDKVFNAGDYAELNEEQYNCAKDLKCSYDPNRPLFREVDKRQESKPAVNTSEKKETIKPQ